MHAKERDCEALLPALLAVVIAGVWSHGAIAAAPAAVDKEQPVQLVQANAARVTAVQPVARPFRPDEAAVRAAAARGPDELRWYILRTRMIHHFYIWDFAKEDE
jgi:hypothetical protein